MSVAQTAAQPNAVPEDAVLSAREAWALVGSQPLAQLSNMALLPSLGAMRADLDLSYGELGIVVASFGFARLVMDLPAGDLARRFNPRSVLLSAFAISTLASASGLAAVNAWQIATVRLCIGIASSAAQAMILAWLVGGAGRAARGRIMARSEAFFSIVGLIVPSLGGLLAQPLGWRAAFLVGAVAAAIGFVAVLLLTNPAGASRSVGRDPSLRASESTSGGWRDLRLGGRALLSAYIVTFVVFFSRNGLLNAVLPVMGADRFGIQPVEIGILFSVLNAFSVGVVLLGGRAGDRFGRYRLLGPGLAVLLATQVLLFVVHDSMSYVVIGLMQALSFFVNALPASVLGDALPARARPQAIGVYRAVGDVGLLSAPALMGAALQVGGFPAAELVSVAVVGLACAGVVALSLSRRKPPDNPVEASAGAPPESASGMAPGVEMACD